jgi:hypothetical protein
MAMVLTRCFTEDEARRLGEQIGIDWTRSTFSVHQFWLGLEVELEHGLRHPETDVTHDDPVMTAKIARAHLMEFPDYYTRLHRMESEAEEDPILQEDQPAQLR